MRYTYTLRLASIALMVLLWSHAVGVSGDSLKLCGSDMRPEHQRSCELLKRITEPSLAPQQFEQPKRHDPSVSQKTKIVSAPVRASIDELIKETRKEAKANDDFVEAVVYSPTLPDWKDKVEVHSIKGRDYSLFVFQYMFDFSEAEIQNARLKDFINEFSERIVAKSATDLQESETLQIWGFTDLFPVEGKPKGSDKICQEKGQPTASNNCLALIRAFGVEVILRRALGTVPDRLRITLHAGQDPFLYDVVRETGPQVLDTLGLSESIANLKDSLQLAHSDRGEELRKRAALLRRIGAKPFNKEIKDGFAKAFAPFRSVVIIARK